MAKKEMNPAMRAAREQKKKEKARNKKQRQEKRDKDLIKKDPLELKREPGDGYWSEVWNAQPFCASYWGGRPVQDQMYSSSILLPYGAAILNWMVSQFFDYSLAYLSELVLYLSLTEKLNISIWIF